MTTLDLQLRWDQSMARETHALFLPGDDPQAWLRQITRWRGKHEEISLFVVSASVAKPRPAGVFVVFPEPVTGLPGLAFARIGRGFYLPAEGSLFPAVDQVELTRLFPFEVTIYHPTLGLSGFDRADALKVDSLLELPRLDESDWGHAVPLHGLNRRLVSIRLEAPETFEEMFDREAQDIGSDPVKPPKSIFGKSKKRPESSAKGGQESGSSAQHLSAPQWLGGIGNWAGQKLEALRQSIESVRNRELTNLLDVLTKNPEEGLKRAIPLSSTPHRGTAPPSDRLGNRNVDFNLGRMGSGPADFWNIPLHIEMQLRARYLALANHETQLGHYRRAAYIYAELLGDLHSAANVLKQGRHFRESAILFRDHLHNRSAAAQCFEEGGLLPDALALFTEMGSHRDVGRICRKMGQEEAANAAFRKAVAELVASGNLILAARILETDLAARDEALDLLDSAWPVSSQAVAALEVYFQLCQRDNLSERLSQRLQRFSKEKIPASALLPALKLITDLPSQNLVKSVQRYASDLSRVLIGNALAAGSSKQTHELTELVTKLAPGDAQLRRDAARFADRAATEAMIGSRRNVPNLSAAVKFATVVAEFNLPAHVGWKKIVASGACFYGVGILGNKILAIRGLWNGHLQTMSWERTHQDDRDFLLEADPSHPYQVYLCGLAHDAHTMNRLLPADDQFSQRFCEIGTPSWVRGDNLLAVAARGGKVAVLSFGDKPNPNLAIYTRLGGLLAMFGVPYSMGTAKPCVCMFGNALVGSLGQTLWHATESKVETEELDSSILALTPSREHTRPAYVLVTERQAELRWLGSDRELMLADDMHAPHAAFLRDGRIVLLDRNDGRIYDASLTGINEVTRFEWRGREPLALTHAGERSKVAVFDREGHVQVLMV